MTRHTPELVESLRRLKGERNTNPQIAMMLGITEGTVESICYKHGIRKGGRKAPVGRPQLIIQTTATPTATETKTPIVEAFERFMAERIPCKNTNASESILFKAFKWGWDQPAIERKKARLVR